MPSKSKLKLDTCITKQKKKKKNQPDQSRLRLQYSTFFIRHCIISISYIIRILYLIFK